MATNLSASVIRVEWRAPELPNGNIREYRVRYFLSQLQDREGAPTMTVPGTNTSVTVESLQPFTEYTFSVLAVTIATGAAVEVNATTSEAGISKL